jgi:hypothetical protein
MEASCQDMRTSLMGSETRDNRKRERERDQP